ncbi:MAG TPA: hypothetical protein VN784_18260 [Candidatus Limnocylindrales bacterium]|nr:hypothetical protein [Candidatus Limnocylindrales bacterium]
MNNDPSNSNGRRAGGLLKTGIVFSAISFVTGLGNMAFQGVMGRHLNEPGQYGNANSAISGFMPLLALLPSVASFAVTHYIAHFNARGDTARLQGLFMGCRRFLFRLTVLGSLLAVIVVGPLSDFFHFSRSLTLVTLGCTLLGLWGSFATALCQGLAWFKRLAFIGLLAMTLRMAFGWLVTLKWPSAETAVLASAFALLANLVLLFWRKDLSLHGEPVSPWDREFVQYLIVSTACVGGGYCFFQGDLLVAKKFFPHQDLDAYTAAGSLARALLFAVAPLLTVLFTSRSSAQTGGIVMEQLKLLGLNFLGLIFGAAALFVLRAFYVKLIFGKSVPEAEAMISQLAITMVFVGLLQALALWALASRWMKISLLYGVLGVGYWLTLLVRGQSPTALLQTMPVAAGTAFGLMFLVWFLTMRRHKATATN